MKTLTKLVLFFSLVINDTNLNSQISTQWNGPSVDFNHGKLKVSENKRFLQFTDGTPFFYLGDTGWELFHRLDSSETEKYLENRRAKGYNVIQAVVLAELDGLNTPNRNGDIPLYDHDPLKPNEKYFQYVDYVVKLAESKGIFIGMLPTWGDKVVLNQWGTGPVIFNKDNAYLYGQWIGKRYKDFRNIIWINGGDRQADGELKEVWDALARGIKSTDPNHLMTFHPMGGSSSSQNFHQSEWLDFNMSQTGHCNRDFSPYVTLIRRDYDLKPLKPCMDGEPRYEDHPVCWNPDVLGWFNDVDIRQAAYWSVFSGSFGHTYGCNPIWQMHTPEKKQIGYVRNTWQTGLDLPGSFQIGNIRKLIESRPFFSRVPAQELIVNEYNSEIRHIVATRGEGYAMVYIPHHDNQAEIDLSKLGFINANLWWYNPQDGTAQNAGKLECKGRYSFKAPKREGGNDWVLVIDQLEKGYKKPGNVLD